MYAVSIEKSINRILKTPLVTRAMRPEFGSRLYELRDRAFNDEYKLKATRYTYEAIKRHEPRVSVEKVSFRINPVTGVIVIVIALANGQIIEVKND